MRLLALLFCIFVVIRSESIINNQYICKNIFSADAIKDTKSIRVFKQKSTTYYASTKSTHSFESIQSSEFLSKVRRHLMGYHQSTQKNSLSFIVLPHVQINLDLIFVKQKLKPELSELYSFFAQKAQWAESFLNDSETTENRAYFLWHGVLYKKDIFMLIEYNYDKFNRSKMFTVKEAYEWSQIKQSGTDHNMAIMDPNMFFIPPSRGFIDREFVRNEISQYPSISNILNEAQADVSTHILFDWNEPFLVSFTEQQNHKKRITKIAYSKPYQLSENVAMKLVNYHDFTIQELDDVIGAWAAQGFPVVKLPISSPLSSSSKRYYFIQPFDNNESDNKSEQMFLFVLIEKSKSKPFPFIVTAFYPHINNMSMPYYRDLKKKYDKHNFSLFPPIPLSKNLHGNSSF